MENKLILPYVLKIAAPYITLRNVFGTIFLLADVVVIVILIVS